MIYPEGDFREKYSNLEVVANISDEDHYNILLQAYCVVISIEDGNILVG